MLMRVAGMKKKSIQGIFERIQYRPLAAKIQLKLECIACILFGATALPISLLGRSRNESMNHVSQDGILSL